MRVLVIDVGGTHVKLAIADGGPSARFASGPALTPDELVRQTVAHASGWSYDAVSLGYPGSVDRGGPVSEPGNLANGWVGFDFAGPLGAPVRVVNDAVLQALGAYEKGRMLFLGLGTGLGSALVTERVIVPLELGELPHSSGELLWERLGRAGLERHGLAEWQRDVLAITSALRRAFAADEVVLGGGNAARLDTLPAGARRGGNDDAVVGGDRLWREFVEPHDRTPSTFWRVVQ